MRYLEIYEYTNHDIDPRNKSISFEEIDKNKILTALNQYRNGNIIYRGLNGLQNSYKFLYTDPTQHERKSANTKNYYTLLIDNLPSWEEYPKRSRSLICTTNHERSRIRGSDYIVLPLDNPKIGICPRFDIWVSLQQAIIHFDVEDLSIFNDLFEQLYGILFGENKLSEHMSWPEFQNILNEMNAEYNRTKPSIKNYLELFKQFFKIDDDIYKTLEHYFDPKLNKFSLTSLSELNTKRYKNNEIWFSGPAYMINTHENLNELMDKLK